MSNLTTSIQLTQNSKYKLSNGYQIPVAGFGVYTVPEGETFELVYEALVQGYRHIDTAYFYKNEEETARAIHQFLKDNAHVKREDIWYTTKLMNTTNGYENTVKIVEETAAKVKKYIDYVDLYLIHSPKSDRETRLGTWKALQEYVGNPSNKTLNIHSIGVSNYGIKHLEELLNWDGLLVKPVINQLELHPWSPQLKLREYLVKHHILVEAYSPLTQGVKLNDPELLQLEHTYRIPKAEILLKWSYLQGFIVLAKTAKKERIAQNLNVLPKESNTQDALDVSSHLGKVDLDINILDALNKPDSHEICTWGGEDSTLYEDPK